jgi:16S rRNA (uracil1498-N3)-methyltransferase
MTIIYLPELSTKTDSITVKGDKAKYLISVLRHGNGDRITVGDGKGSLYLAEIIGVIKNGLTLEIISKHDSTMSPSVHVTLFQGILKGAKMDLVVQKSSELGVDVIVPVVTERSQLKATRKLPRWRKIAEEASRQSLRDTIPEIHETVDFAKLFRNAKKIASDDCIMFWEKGYLNFTEIKDNLVGTSRISVFIGPEGGFSKNEVELASESGVFIATLGKRILRAETAAITALSIVQYEFGNLGMR